MKIIPHSSPWITAEDGAALQRVLSSRMLAQGALARELEQRLARWVGAVEGVATGSGSAAIALALQALNAGGGEVILPTYVCRSVLEAVLSAGARPVLCDVGEDWVMEARHAAPLVGRATRCIIVCT